MSRGFFTENAYNVLGLDSGASEKVILKRSREIENLLKIKQVPEYETDLPSSKGLRTAAKVKKAVEKLTVPSKKIAETYFWLFIKDSTDEKAFKLYKEGKHVEAIDVLRSKISASPNNFTALRNKAVFESLIFSEKAQNKYLEASLKSWQDILSSDKQWTNFKKVYKLNNPNVSDALFNDFKKNAEKILSSFYESMSKAEDKPEIYAAFSKRFSAHSDHFERETLDPLLNKLDTLTKKINKFEIEFEENSYQDDKWVSSESFDTLKDMIDDATAITDEIEALGKNIWNSSKVNVTRDENAAALRGKAIDVFNNSNLTKNSSDKDLVDELLDIAYDICSENSPTEKRIEQDKEGVRALDGFINYTVRMNKVNIYIRARRFDKAVLEIDELLIDERIPENVKGELREIKRNCSMRASNLGWRGYGAPQQTKSGGKGWIWIVIIIIVISIICIAANQSNQNKINETSKICKKYGITSSECTKSESKNGVVCTGTGLNVKCKLK